MNPRSVAIVDDDEAVRDALSWLFSSKGLPTLSFASGEALLAAFDVERIGCLVGSGIGGLQPGVDRQFAGLDRGFQLGQPGFGCAHLSAQSLFFFKARLCHLQDGQNARLGQAFHHIGGHAGLDRRPNAAVATIIGKHHDRVRRRLAEHAHLLQRIATG